MSVDKSELESYITRIYGETKFKQGRWRIIKFNSGPEGHYLWHKCDKTAYKLCIVEYWSRSPKTGYDIKPGWRCSDCFKPAPNGIVGLYCMLEPDEAFKQMSKSLAYRENGKSLPDWREDFREALNGFSGWNWL